MFFIPPLTHQIRAWQSSKYHLFYNTCRNRQGNGSDRWRAKCRRGKQNLNNQSTSSEVIPIPTAEARCSFPVILFTGIPIRLPRFVMTIVLITISAIAHGIVNLSKIL